jgi:DNA polymerase-1
MIKGVGDKMTKKLLLIDSYSLANRAFFALPPMTSRSGQPTNAVYGMAMMLLKMVDEMDPDYLVAAFDSAGPTFRHLEFTEYKAQRLRAEDAFRTQIPIIRELLATMGIPIMEQPGFEADDIIGSLAKQAARKGLQVEIITGDRDAYQLAEPTIHVLYTRRGITELDHVDPDFIRERYQLTPDQLIDLKGMMGDASDNIPGVPGFGEKTALKYLHRFGSLEAIYEHLEEIERERERELLRQYRDQAFLSRKMATIIIDLNVNTDFDTYCGHRGFNRKALLEFCREYQFNSLIKKLSGGAEEIAPADMVSPKLTAAIGILDESGLPETLRLIRAAGWCAVQFLAAAAGWNSSRALGIGFASEGGQWFFPMRPGQRLPTVLQELLADDSVKKIGYDVKRQMIIASSLGAAINGLLDDVFISGYLVNAGVRGLELEELSETYLKQSLTAHHNSRGARVSWSGLPESLGVAELAPIAAGRLAAVILLQHEFLKQMIDSGVDALYGQVEQPLIRVLFNMERAGIRVDPKVLRDFGATLRRRQEELESDIYQLAEEKFNIGSPKQIGTILYEKLGLPAPKKTKTGFSTDAEALESLTGAHPIIPLLLEYRQNTKLQSTYIDSLIALIHPDTGRVHTTFNQAVTTTGRLSSTEPNLQNIPVRSEEGRMIRRAFVAGEGKLLLAADYSQIELRVMAHFSQDPAFMEAFLKGEDIHRSTAAAVQGVPLAEVSREMRDRAKAVNFGIIYGISSFGLARNIKVSRKEADSFIEAYFHQYPGVKKYVEQLIVDARFTGEARTLMGRLRKLPELASRNFTLRSFAERMARNTPLQGTAADIIKLAMVRIDEHLRQRPELGIMLLQVHDELIFETTETYRRELADLVKREMETAVTLSVPLVVDFKSGANWGDLLLGNGEE